MFIADPQEALSGELDTLLGSMTSMEDVLSQLGIVKGTVSTEGICRSDATFLSGLDAELLPSRAPVNSFTAYPSKTNLTVALEAIDGKRTAIIAGIIAALGAFLYKLLSWIGGNSSNGVPPIETAVTKVETATTKVEGTFKVLDEHVEQVDNASALKKHIDNSIRKSVKEGPLAAVASHLTDEMMDRNSPVSRTLKALATTIIFNLYKAMIEAMRMYNSIVKNPSANEDKWYDQSSEMMNRAKFSSVSEAILKQVDKVTKDILSLDIMRGVRDSGEMTPKSAATALMAKIREMEAEPSRQTVDFTYDRFKKELGMNELSVVGEALLDNAGTIALFIQDTRDEVLISKQINWPENIKNDPEAMRRAEAVFKDFRDLLKDLGETLYKLYSINYFSLNKYYDFINQLDKDLVFADKEYSDAKVNALFDN